MPTLSVAQHMPRFAAAAVYVVSAKRVRRADAVTRTRWSAARSVGRLLLE